MDSHAVCSPMDAGPENTPSTGGKVRPTQFSIPYNAKLIHWVRTCELLVTSERYRKCTARPKHIINGHILKSCPEIRKEGHTQPMDTNLGSSSQSRCVCPKCEDVRI